jgi:hypothetical protein
MRAYRCHLLRSPAATAAVVYIEAESDAEAVERARELFRAKGSAFNGIELWDRERRVEREFHHPPEQIRRWRLKAAELRIAAQSFADGSARHALLHSADTYEALAIDAEALLQHRKQRTPEAV